MFEPGQIRRRMQAADEVSPDDTVDAPILETEEFGSPITEEELEELELDDGFETIEID